MKILVLGGGGREHALCWKLKQSPLCTALYCAPGNAGIRQDAQCLPDIDPCSPGAVLAFCQQQNIDLIVIGPEAPLVAGVSDALRTAGFAVFGPSQQAAQLESSKGFMKDLCQGAGIPTAAYARFTGYPRAEAYIKEQGAPIVVKADGLAAGKGVVVAQTVTEALDAARDMLEANRFGDAGASIVVEEFLDGEELSFFALLDGDTVVPLTSARDHKRACDGDKGPNTGGMGAFSPASVATPELVNTIIETILKPTGKALLQQGIRYQGILYAGLMLTSKGAKLLEYNARFGDPECQVLMPRLADDLLPVLLAVARGNLATLPPLHWKPETALGIVYAARGYPGTVEKGTAIHNLDTASGTATIFHAATTRDNDGTWRANGGRVLTVVSTDADFHTARQKAYQAVKAVRWEEGFYRGDIGG